MLKFDFFYIILNAVLFIRLGILYRQRRFRLIQLIFRFILFNSIFVLIRSHYFPLPVQKSLIADMRNVDDFMSKLDMLCPVKYLYFLLEYFGVKGALSYVFISDICLQTIITWYLLVCYKMYRKKKCFVIYMVIISFGVTMLQLVLIHIIGYQYKIASVGGAVIGAFSCILTYIMFKVIYKSNLAHKVYNYFYNI